MRRAPGWRIGVDDLARDAHAAARGDGLAGLGDPREYGVASPEIDVADVDLEMRPARHAVDSAGKQIAHADGAHGVERTGRPRRVLDGQSDLGRGQECVASIRHQHGARMSTFAFDPIRRPAGAAIAVTMPRSRRCRSSSGPCSMCNSTNAA